MIKKHPAPDLTLLRAKLRYNQELGALFWMTKSRFGKMAGRVNSVTGYRQINFEGDLHQAHRLIWYHFYGVWPENDIDHVDSSKLNNKISNLREATRSQNLRNRKKHVLKKLPLGVYKYTYKPKFKESSEKPFYAKIKAQGKNTFLGSFATVFEAEEAYIQASIREGGTFSPFRRA